MPVVRRGHATQRLTPQSQLRLPGHARQVLGAHIVKVLLLGGVQDLEVVERLLPLRLVGWQGGPSPRIKRLRQPQAGILLQPAST